MNYNIYKDTVLDDKGNAHYTYYARTMIDDLPYYASWNGWTACANMVQTVSDITELYRMLEHIQGRICSSVHEIKNT